MSTIELNVSGEVCHASPGSVSTMPHRTDDDEADEKHCPEGVQYEVEKELFYTCVVMRC